MHRGREQKVQEELKFHSQVFLHVGGEERENLPAQLKRRKYKKNDHSQRAYCREACCEAIGCIFQAHPEGHNYEIRTTNRQG